jgi:hypothetical protein
LFSQQPSTTNVRVKEQKTKTLAPKEQQQGLQLLKTSLAETAGLQPDMRTFVLWQIAHAYDASTMWRGILSTIACFRQRGLHHAGSNVE